MKMLILFLIYIINKYLKYQYHLFSILNNDYLTIYLIFYYNTPLRNKNKKFYIFNLKYIFIIYKFIFCNICTIPEREILN